jgi:DNA-binding CsgD family transcriptional regulator
VEGILDDLRAVLAATRTERLVLFGSNSYAAPAVRYTAEHPEKVAALIIYDPSPLAATIGLAVPPSLGALARSDWDALLRMLATSHHYPANDQELQQDVEVMRRTLNQDDYMTILDGGTRWDVKPYLPLVQAPTLVLASASKNIETIERDYSGVIPDATVAMLPALASCPVREQREPTLEAIDRFLAERVPEALRICPVPAATSSNGTSALSDREAEVLRLIASGRTNRQIADTLIISAATVARHVSHVLEKTGAANRAEATAWAMRRGIA